MRAKDYKTTKQASDYYHRRFTNGMALVSEDEMSIIRKWIINKFDKPAIILDLGTGTGRIVNELIHQSPKVVYATDNSPTMLGYFEKLYRKQIQKKEIKTILAPSDKVPISSNSTDLVTTLHLFKHLVDIEPTLKEAHRVLKPKGYLIFDCLNSKSIIRFNLDTCFTLNESDVVQKLNYSGFKVVDIIYLHLFGETIYNIFNSKFAKIVHNFDKMVSKIFSKSGTKIFILSQKI